MMIIQIAVWWIIFLPWCYSVTDIEMSNSNSDDNLATHEVFIIGGREKLNDALDDRFILLNGNHLTLREIYGDILPTEYNFRPGHKLAKSIFHYDEEVNEKPRDVNEICAGSVYVERELSFYPTSTILIPPILEKIQDTPTAIAKKIANDVSMKAPSITLLLGGYREGKSVILSKIHNKLAELMPTSWSIHVDLSRTFPNRNYAQHVTLEYIIDEYVDEGASDLFYNLLEINPRKIVFLFDGVNEMTSTRGEALAPIIKTLFDKGVALVLSGTQHTIGWLEGQNLHPNTWAIPEMNFRETSQFLTNIWKAAIKEQQAELTLSNEKLKLIDKNLDDYVSAFTTTLYETPMPRQPATLAILADKFKLTENLINSYDRLSTHSQTIGCLEYVFDDGSVPSSLTTIRNIKLDKALMYDKFFAGLTRYTHDLDDPTSYYGATALKQVINEVENFQISQDLINLIGRKIGNREILSAILQPITRDLKVSENILNKNIESAGFIHHVENGQYKFIYPDFQNFFASEFVMTFLYDPDSFEFLLQKIFREPRYAKILEFMNCRSSSIEPEHLLKIILRDKRLDSIILDNIIVHGYEDLFLKISNLYSELNKLSVLQNYFQEQYIPAYESKRVFGMMEVEQKYNVDIDKSSEVSSRLEILVKNGMLRALKNLDNLQINLHAPFVDWQHLLDCAVTISTPNLQLVEFLTKKIVPLSFQIDFNELLINTVRKVGDGCQPIVTYLIECGANPHSLPKYSEALLNAAVKWNSVNLLRFLVEKLELSVNTADESLLRWYISALDANPSPLHTSPGWWEMMHYLVERMNNLPNPMKLYEMVQESDLLRVSRRDCESPWFKFILGTEEFDQTSSTDGIFNMKIHPIAENDFRYQPQFAKFRFIPPALWGFDSNALGLRRNVLLQKLSQHHSQISSLELFINYRGLDPLSSKDHQYYQKIIKILFEREQHLLSTEVRKRILNTFIHNIGTIDDLHDFKYFIHLDLLPNLDSGINSIWQNELEERMRKAEFDSSSHVELLTVQQRFQQLRVDYDPKIFNLLKFKQEYNIFIESISGHLTSANIHDLDVGMLNCLLSNE